MHPFLQGSVLEPGLLSIHRLLRRGSGRLLPELEGMERERVGVFMFWDSWTSNKRKGGGFEDTVVTYKCETEFPQTRDV